MGSKRLQRGITFWGISFVLGVLAFALFLTFNLLPPYLEDVKVKSALDSLVRQPDIATMSKADIAAALDKRFDIDSVTTVKPAKHLFVETRGKVKVIRISYEAVVPLVYNVSALLEFNHAKEVRGVE